MKKEFLNTQRQFLQLLISMTVFFLPLISSAQSIDSLILKHTDASGKVNIDSLRKVGKDFLYSSHPEKSYEIAVRMVNLSKLQDEPINLANSYRLLGAYYADVKSNWDSAYSCQNKAENIFRSIGDEKGIGDVLHNYGTIKTQQGDYMQAVVFYTQALRILNRVNDTETIPKTLSNLAALFAYLKDFKKAEFYYRECLKLSQALGDELMITQANLGVADAVISQNKSEGVKKMLDQVLQVAEKRDNQFQLASGNFIYGKYYHYRLRDFENAMRYYQKSLDVAIDIDNVWLIARSRTMLSHAYYDSGQYEKAREMAEIAVQNTQELEVDDLTERGMIVLARSNAKIGNLAMAFGQIDSAYILRDTIFNRENLQRLSLLETEYQTEKKELQIQSLEKQRKLYIWLGISGIVILLIAFAFAFIRYRLAVSKRKLAEEKSGRLEQEKQLVAVQATLDGEAAERSRLAKDLHDGLGGMLSAVKLNLPQVKGDAFMESVDVRQFQTALGMLDDSIRELRRVAHHMMPESLLRFGLKVSLADFCEAIPGADFHYFGDQARLSDKMEIMIYRCIHELVNNSLKHAHAEHINVQLVREADRVSFTVQDDGKGFDQKNTPQGMGLTNINQRVEAFQGDLNIYSSEKGTEVHVEIPLN